MTIARKTKIRNAFSKKISTDIKLSKAQLAKINQSGRLLVALLGKLAGLLMKVAVTLAKNVLAALVPMVSTSAVNGAIQRRMHGRGVVKTNKQKKGITTVISNKDMDDIIRINKSLKNSGISIT